MSARVSLTFSLSHKEAERFLERHGLLGLANRMETEQATVKVGARGVLSVTFPLKRAGVGQ